MKSCPVGTQYIAKTELHVAVSDLVPISDVFDLVLATTLISCPPDFAVNLNCHISLCTVYVPPNSADGYHKCLLSYLHSRTETVIIVGDFNMPDICWSTGTSTSFCDFMYKMNLTQLVMDSNHVKGNILDLVTTNTKNLISIAESHPLISSSRYIIFCHLYEELPINTFLTIPKPVFVGPCDHLLDSDVTAFCQVMWNMCEQISNLLF